MSPAKQDTGPGPIVIGVDTHKHQHIAAAVDPARGLLATAAFGNDRAGHAALAAWAAALGPVEAFGIEGTSSWGKTLTAHLTSHGARIIEVNTTSPGERRSRGKSDPLDAEAAARAVLDGRANAVPKTGTGPAEALRTLTIARDGAVKARTEAGNALQALLTDDPDLAQACKAKGRKATAQHLARLRPGKGTDARTARRTALRSTARRWLALDTEAADLEHQITTLAAQAAPDLVGAYGIGPHTAATILTAVGDNPDRIRSEAAFAKMAGACPLPTGSGQTAGRHRLNRGGNRGLNRALYLIALTRMAGEQRTKDFVTRQLARGKTKKETIRILKRHIAREIYRLLPAPTT
jgi:transposase